MHYLNNNIAGKSLKVLVILHYKDTLFWTIKYLDKYLITILHIRDGKYGIFFVYLYIFYSSSAVLL